MWIDDDSPKLLNAGLITHDDFLEIAQRNHNQTKTEIAMRKQRKFNETMAGISGPLNAYDRNVMRLWLEGGCVGNRPMLSFEIRAINKTPDEIKIEQRARELEIRAMAHEAAERAKRFRARKALKSERAAATKAAWDAEHPEEAGKREQRKALVSARRQQEKQEREAAEAERRRLMQLEQEHRALVAAVNKKIVDAGPRGKQALLQLNEDEFKIWSEEIASIEQLEAFGEDLFRDGTRLRQHFEEQQSPIARWWQAITQNENPGW